LPLLLPFPVAAQQFATRQSGNWQQFGYRYQDARGNPYTLSFSLNADDISRGSTEFAAWNDAEARQTAFNAVAAKAQALSGQRFSVGVSPREKGFEVRISGYGPAVNQQAGDAVSAQLNDTYYQALGVYARQRFYLTRKESNATVIQPDHARLAGRYTAAMAPVAQAIMNQLAGQGVNVAQNQRAFINAALLWLQNIPYDDLQDRYTSNGAGFQTPYGLLLANKGDCDTKATALAALLRAAYPGLPMAMVYIPEHAFLGIGIPRTNRDFGLQTASGTYVLADPTGPGLAPLGDIDDYTRNQLAARNTTILPIP
jgi:hypothetical protein